LSRIFVIGEIEVEIFGLSLVLITVLYLIDKNQQWRATWRTVKVAVLLSAILGVVAAIGYGSYYLYQRHREAKLAAAQAKQEEDWFEKNKPIDLSAGLVPKPTPEIQGLPAGAIVVPIKDYDAIAQQSGGSTVYTLREAAAKYGALAPVPSGFTLDNLPNGAKPWKVTVNREEYAFLDRAQLDAFVRAVGLTHKRQR
jgi:uncharacterized membrane protein YsdA (DUF1294 family)